MALFALMVLGLGACGKPDAVARYDCSAKGERFVYQASQRQGQTGEVQVNFALALRAGRPGFELGRQPALSELADPGIVFDAVRSSPAESVYLLDRIDPATGVRRVSSLVLNLTSGNVRLFHHRWVPPVQWQDSDQYLYVGNCHRL